MEYVHVGSNCPGISGTVLDFWNLSQVLDGHRVCPGIWRTLIVAMRGALLTCMLCTIAIPVKGKQWSSDTYMYVPANSYSKLVQGHDSC